MAENIRTAWVYNRTKAIILMVDREKFVSFEINSDKFISRLMAVWFHRFYVKRILKHRWIPMAITLLSHWNSLFCWTFPSRTTMLEEFHPNFLYSISHMMTMKFNLQVRSVFNLKFSMQYHKNNTSQ